MFTALNTVAKKILPEWIFNKLFANQPTAGFKKYFINTAWLFIARIFSFTVSFFMVAIVARYLGPENLGKLSYAQSFIAIFSVFASLGIDQILFRDLVAHPEKEYELLGTAFWMKLTFGTLTAFTTTTVAYFTNPDPVLTTLIAILSLTFIFSPFGVMGTVFNARVRAKYTALSQIALYIILPILKLLIIFFGKGIIFFAGVIALETLLSAGLSFYFYTTAFKHSPFKWRFNITYAKPLFLNSLPLLFAGVFGYLFSRIDQVMLQHMLGSESVGLYSISVNLTETVGMMSGILIASLFPALIHARKNDTALYKKRLKQLLLLLLIINGSIAMTLVILSPFIVPLLFGAAFAGSISILALFAWKLVVASPLTVMQQYLIAENRTKLYLSASIFTAILNITLNYNLIPLYGPHGAAIATIISYGSYILIPLIVIYFGKHSIKTNLNHGI